MRWTLRKGVKFHNGEDFTAETVKARSSSTRPPCARRGGRQLNAVKRFRITDAHTIDLITEHPNRPLLRNATQGDALSPRAIKELGDRYATTPVGTGQMNSSSTGRASTW